MVEDVVRLRERVDALVPTVHVDTTVVVPRARRRRAATRAAALAVVAGVVATGAVWAAEGPRAAAPPADGPTVQDDGRDGRGEAAVDDAAVDDAAVDDDADDDAGQATDGWPDAPYWHVLYEVQDMTGATTGRSELWYGHDAPGVGLIDGEPMAFGPASWGALRLAGSPLEGDYPVVADGLSLVTWDLLDELPTDPAVLEDILRASVDPDTAVTEDELVFGVIVDLLRGSPAPPGLRLALWHVAGDLEGSEAVQLMEDPQGRVVSFLDRSRTGGPAAGQYRFDPADGRLLEVLQNPTAEQLAAHPDEIVMGWHAVFVEEGPAQELPFEPTLELAGCPSWESC